jgi:hypothetical protein
MDQFVDHLKNLISNDNVDNETDTTDTMEYVFGISLKIDSARL